VYRSRAGRCYEISGLPEEAGHAKAFCGGSCEVCDYFRVVQGQKLNVLVVTDQQQVRLTLKDEAENIDYNLRLSDSEYHCSLIVEKFRPDYVVVDCSLGRKRSRELARNLERDPRIPFVRVVLAGESEEIPKECDKSVFAFIRRPFSIDQLTELVRGLRPESPAARA
jgi:DNA-binding NtrC family response regulator